MKYMMLHERELDLPSIYLYYYFIEEKHKRNLIFHSLMNIIRYLLHLLNLKPG